MGVTDSTCCGGNRPTTKKQIQSNIDRSLRLQSINANNSKNRDNKSESKYTEDVNVIIRFNEDEINWNYHENNISLASLQEFISNQFDINNNFLLKYSNSEKGNQVEIIDDDDLNEACKCIEDENENKLKIFVIEYIMMDIPLHRFTVHDVVNTIKQWVYSDIDYKMYRSKIKEIFKNHELNGDKMGNLSGEDIKCLIKDDISQFITSETLDLMINCIHKWKDNDLNDIKIKSAEHIGGILYDVPFKQLIDLINDEKIDGNKIINIFEEENNKNNNMIKTETGWKVEEIEQIKLLLFKWRSFTKQQMMDNINKVFPSKYMASYSSGIYGLYSYDRDKINISSIPDMIINKINL